MYLLKIAVLVVAICLAEAGNGRFKYIKRPVSKYRHHGEDQPQQEQGLDDEIIPSSEGDAPPEEQPPPDQPPQDQPPPEQPPQEAPQPPPEGEQPIPEQQPSQEDSPPSPPQDEADMNNMPPVPSEGDGGMSNLADPPSQPPQENYPPPEGQGQQDGYTTTTQYPQSGESQWPNENGGGDFRGSASISTELYTNELGEPMYHFSTLTPGIVSMRRSPTTIINGRRFRIPNLRRGWNRQTVISSGD